MRKKKVTGGADSYFYNLTAPVIQSLIRPMPEMNLDTWLLSVRSLTCDRNHSISMWPGSKALNVAAPGSGIPSI